mmetsp:Transcript_11256/g.17051  ORF Transcript_11256/g.17051 Transcript_11256/m.17051 type:complete len:122 (+) Transcript_11256:2-367(+)
MSSLYVTTPKFGSDNRALAFRKTSRPHDLLTERTDQAGSARTEMKCFSQCKDSRKDRLPSLVSSFTKDTELTLDSTWNGSDAATPSTCTSTTSKRDDGLSASCLTLSLETSTTGETAPASI